MIPETMPQYCSPCSMSLGKKMIEVKIKMIWYKVEINKCKQIFEKVAQQSRIYGNNSLSKSLAENPYEFYFVRNSLVLKVGILH